MSIPLTEMPALFLLLPNSFFKDKFKFHFLHGFALPHCYSSGWPSFLELNATLFIIYALSPFGFSTKQILRGREEYKQCLGTLEQEKGRKLDWVDPAQT